MLHIALIIGDNIIDKIAPINNKINDWKRSVTHIDVATPKPAQIKAHTILVPPLSCI